MRTDVLEPGSSNQGLSFIILIVSIAPIQADRAAGLETCRPVIRTGCSERDLLALTLFVGDPRAAGQGQNRHAGIQRDTHIAGIHRLNRLFGRSGVAAGTAAGGTTAAGTAASVARCRDFNRCSLVAAELAFFMLAAFFSSGCCLVYHPLEGMSCFLRLCAAGTFMPVLVCVGFPFGAVGVGVRSFKFWQLKV